MKIFFNGLKIILAITLTTVTFSLFYLLNKDSDSVTEKNQETNKPRSKFSLENNNERKISSISTLEKKAFIEEKNNHEKVTVLPKGKRLYDEEAMKLIATDVNGDSYSDDFHTDENVHSR